MLCAWACTSKAVSLFIVVHFFTQTSTATQTRVLILMDQTQEVGLALPNFTSTATQTTVLVLTDQIQDVGLALPNFTKMEFSFFCTRHRMWAWLFQTSPKWSSHSFVPDTGCGPGSSKLHQNGVLVLLYQTQDVGLALPNFTKMEFSFFCTRHRMWA